MVGDTDIGLQDAKQQCCFWRRTAPRGLPSALVSLSSKVGLYGALLWTNQDTDSLCPQDLHLF